METRREPLAGGIHTVRLPVRVVDTVVHGGDHIQQNEVFCPRRRASVEMATCCGCPRIIAIETDDDGAIHVTCTPASAPEMQPLAGGAMPLEPVRAVRGDMTLQELASLFALEGTMRLAVVDDAGHLMGVVEEKDMCAEYMLRLREVSSCEARQLAHASVRINETTTVHDALRTMAAHRLRSIPVVTDDDRFVGWLDDVTALRSVARR